MDDTRREALAGLLLGLVPPNGSAIGNQSLRERFLEAAKAAGYKNTGSALDVAFESLREELLQKGVLAKGKGRGGSVLRAQAEDAASFELGALTSPSPEEPVSPAKAKAAAVRKSGEGEPQVLSYRHSERRKNNPQVGLVNEATDPPQPKTTWRYDPHLDPVLAFDSARSQVERLVDDALASGDAEVMRAALAELKRAGSPYLQWTGKAERTSFDVDTVSLHVHERIDPMSILSVVSKRIKEGKGGKTSGVQPSLFDAPFENLPLRDAVDFYKHDRGWSNRMIAGDSLLVMNSLLQKEGMAGQVQMIYFDPPYGIKYGSNFQPFTGKRDVKDGRDEDLTQEPEMIKAFRDTWELGIHSYLTYLRDRLLLAKELLHESGSVFVQISDENLHHVREILDDVFGADNFCSLITVKKTGGQTSELLPRVADYLVWYAKLAKQVKYRQMFQTKEVGIGEGSGARYDQVEEGDGSRRAMTKPERENTKSVPAGARPYQLTSLISAGFRELTTVDFSFRTRKFFPGDNSNWKTHLSGMERLARVHRISERSSTLAYVRYIDDFPAYPITAVWDDVAGASDKIYVVQSSQSIVERCLLMTTDPGDLVLDPTCGSGTSAFVAEKWGRRWITCDTSRVAITLAKQRLMTASFDYYELRYPHEGLKGGFIYKTVPHVMLKSIANNPEIDENYARLHPAIESALKDLNAALKKHPPAEALQVTEGNRKGEKLNLSKGAALQEWEVPFDFPEDWAASMRKPFDTFHVARMRMQKEMDASIASHADSEILYDQPEKSRTKMRITGPFTVEAVPFPTVLSLDEAEQPKDADVSIARSGESARQHSWRDELLKTGIRGKGGQMLRFASLETLPGTVCLHALGVLDTGERVVVSFGPEHGALEQRQVEHALREAGELFPLPKMAVFCAFEFDPEAAKDIDAFKGITALKAKMNTDLLTEDLKKARSSNQSFWLMGQPDVELRKRKDGLYEIEVNGFDYFDTAKGELVSGGKAKIAMWLLDIDYDDRSLFPRQVFFPMAGKDEGWHKLKKDIRAELDEDLLEKFKGTVSLPFEAGENKRVAVKIVDDRGIESVKVIPLP
ncbi:MAG: site-specific DNA-methyltransferase [Planctomycetia bacterium]|nr:site-specific DNA-methyltransferase [Planctomycetia bacterium]